MTSILGLRVQTDARRLFDVGVVELGLDGRDLGEHTKVAAQLTRTLHGSQAKVRVLSAPAENSWEGLPALRVAARPSGLFRGILHVVEDSTVLIRCHGAEGGAPFGVSVFEFGAGEGFALVPGNRALRTLTFASGIGQVTLVHGRTRLPLLVVSRKLPLPEGADDPVAAVETLVREIWERHLALVRALNRPTTIALGSARGASRSPVQTLMLLDYLVSAGGVGEAWDWLSTEPRTALQVRWPIRDVARARRPVWSGPRGPQSIPGAVDMDDPRFVRDRTTTRTTNTAPNRLAVRLAHRISEAAAMLSSQLGALTASTAAWELRARVVRNRADAFRHHPAMSDVEHHREIDLGTPALRLDPHYRPLVRAWAMLEEGIALPPAVEPLFRDPLKESYELYEYWCWFALCDAVRRHVTESRIIGRVVPSDDAVGTASLPWSLRLEGILHDSRPIAVHYNAPPYGTAPYRSYSLPFRPDLAVVIGAGEAADLSLFDAKYRVDLVTNFETADDTGDSIKRAERRGTSKHDDLKAMHAYRDALRGANGIGSPRWVISLFPGTEVRLYGAGGGPIASSVDALRSAAGGIGAIPVAPGYSDQLDSAVAALVARRP